MHSTIPAVASLRDKTILITRPRAQSSEMIGEIERRGGRVVSLPLIRIGDPSSWERCDSAIGNIGKYDAIVCTSANAVDKFFDRCVSKGIGPESFEHCRIYAVGEKTKNAIAQRGLPVSFSPAHYSGSDLTEYFQSATIEGERFLLPVGNLHRQEVDKVLASRGATVDVVEVYTNHPPEDSIVRSLLQNVESGEVDVVAFASPSAVRNFMATVPVATAAGLVMAVIGPSTKSSLGEYGLHPQIVAEKSTSAGLVQAIENFFNA